MYIVSKIHSYIACVHQLLCKSLSSQDEDYKKNLASKRNCSLARCEEMRIISEIQCHEKLKKKKEEEKTLRGEKDNKSLGNN